MRTQDGGTAFGGKPKTHIMQWPTGKAIWRQLAKLRTALFPYIYQAAAEAHATGLPIMRHLILSFPADAAARGKHQQWMFGPSILVAPVLAPNVTMQRVR